MKKTYTVFTYIFIGHIIFYYRKICVPFKLYEKKMSSMLSLFTWKKYYETLSDTTTFVYFGNTVRHPVNGSMNSAFFISGESQHLVPQHVMHKKDDKAVVSEVSFQILSGETYFISVMVNNKHNVVAHTILYISSIATVLKTTNFAAFLLKILQNKSWQHCPCTHTASCQYYLVCCAFLNTSIVNII